MAYAGDLGNATVQAAIDLSNCGAVVVSGDGPNVCGHMLLTQFGGGGYYFHVASLLDKPRWMNRSGFKRYLTENNKTVLGYYPVKLTNVAAANAELSRLMHIKWLWGAVPHNCVAFVEQILQAGGSDFGLISNCPAVLPAGESISRSVDQGIREFINWASGGYGYSY